MYVWGPGAVLEVCLFFSYATAGSQLHKNSEILSSGLFAITLIPSLASVIAWHRFTMEFMVLNVLDKILLGKLAASGL